MGGPNPFETPDARLGGGAAGAAVGRVIGCIDAICQLFDRISERIALSFALREAAESPLHALREGEKFLCWLKNWLMFSPVLGALTLRGVCADNPYGFKIAAEGRSSETVQIGRLAKQAGEYLRQHKSEYAMKFTSGVTELENRLKTACG